MGRRASGGPFFVFAEMTHPSLHALSNADKLAVTMADGTASLTYGELDTRSNQHARQLRAAGLGPGDVVALCLENSPGFLALVWGAQRSGVTYVCISTRLTVGEVAFIVADSGAGTLIVSPGVEAARDPGALRAALSPSVNLCAFGGAIADWPRWDNLAAAQASMPVDDEQAGAEMLYSSGTTGRPKGILSAAPLSGAIEEPDAVTLFARQLFGVGPDTVYLSPAPLYHAAPLRWCLATQRRGGTVVLMERFDPLTALAAIETWGVTHAQFVPTHFVRMLKLSPAERARHDCSTLQSVAHAAAPCPVPVKQAMIDWWGPILTEYYAGTEGNGMTLITAQEWLERPGSVGRAMIGRVRICDEDGEELPVGKTGLVYFSDGRPFRYHNDPARTAAAANRHGWTTLGDIGHLDADGHLYLSDRRDFMIISGGVNIYPQEIENLLVQHPMVADAAVLGAPDEDMGERVVAFVQPMDWADAGPAFADDLIAWMRVRLSGVKVPREIRFERQLPRHDTGKLYKQALKSQLLG